VQNARLLGAFAKRLLRCIGDLFDINRRRAIIPLMQVGGEPG
jgi:hypothetical protein